jgi:ABC-type spermidine/putrescine transport system permease subunit I
VARRLKANGWDAVGLPGLAFLVLVFLVPLAALVWSSLSDPSPANYTQIVHDPLAVRALVNTLEAAAVVTVSCIVLGYPIAYGMVHLGRFWRSTLLLATLLPMCSSLLVRGYVITIILATHGPINNALISLHLISSPLPLIYNRFAVYFALTNILIPFMILPIFAQLRQIDPNLTMAARGLGARSWTVLRRITVPLSLNGVAAGSVLVFVLTLGFYVVPALVGGPSGLLVSQLIVQDIQQFLQTGLGSALSVVLIMLTFVVLAAMSRFVRLQDLLGLRTKENSPK